MRIILFVFFIVKFYRSVASSPPPVNIPYSDCRFYQINGGITNNLTNKHWTLQKVYADSIPLPDSLILNKQFLFSKDGEFFMVGNTHNQIPDANGFDYVIDEISSKIQIKIKYTGELLFTFNVICLTQGHFALYYDTPLRNEPSKMVRMEYRFLVDYTLENRTIQKILSNSN